MKPLQNLFTPRRVPAGYDRGASSFPRGRAVYGTRTIRRKRLSAESRESRRDSSETRQTTGWPCLARHTGFKAVFTGRGTTDAATRQHTTPSRHCGLDPQSTGWPCLSRHTGFKAVSTGRGTTDAATRQHTTPSRHCGLDPQSRCADGQRRLPAGYDRGASSFPRNLPSFPRRRESTGRPCLSRHTGFKAVSTGRGTTDAATRQHTTPSRHTGFKAVSIGQGTTDAATRHHLTKIG